MSFKITMQASEKANSKLELYPMTLVGMGIFTKDVKVGEKKGSGFIRGQLHGPERRNEYLKTSRILIIDADGGVGDNPTPEAGKCHKALIQLGYNHVIYTTASHTPEYHKYRAIVELDDDIQEWELHANMSQLINELKAQGIQLKYVSEMDVWSQIWFLPRIKEGAEFLHYEWHEGGLFNAIHVEKSSAEAEVVRSRSERKSEDSGDKLTLDEMFENIRTGKEFHSSLRNISYQMIKDGVSVAIVTATLKSAMESSAEAGSERWLERMKDLPRLIKGAEERAEEEHNAQADFDIIIPESSSSYAPPPIPPGRIGKAIMQCMETMARPQIEFAFPMIIGSVAAICGAKFNGYTNEYTGLNVNMTVVAGTGFGKGQISKFYNSLFIGGLGGKVVNLSGGEGAMSFLGTNNYTAPKPLHNDLLKGRSKIVCMQEAGIMLGAKSGNADELSAYVMENYVNSAHHQFSSSRSYSDEANSLKPFRAPALSMVLESTEESLAEALKGMNAIESGYIPRQTMFKVVGKPKMRRNREASTGDIEFDQDIYDQYKLLIKTAASAQVPSDFEVITVSLTDEQFDDYCDLCDMYADAFPDKMAKDIATRMAHKIVKFACLATIFNNWADGDIGVDQECWEWAKKMGAWEMDHLNHNLSYMQSGNDYDAAMQFIAERMIVTLNHKDTSLRNREAKVISKKGLFDRLYIGKDGGARGKIAQIASGKKMGVIPFVEHNLKAMERSGFIRIDENSKLLKRGGCAIHILEGINILLGGV